MIEKLGGQAASKTWLDHRIHAYPKPRVAAARQHVRIDIRRQGDIFECGRERDLPWIEDETLAKFTACWLKVR